MRDAAWTVFVVVVVVFLMLVALEVARRSEWRSPVAMAADLFTRPRDLAPLPPSPLAPSPATNGGGSLMTNAGSLDLAS